MMNRINLPLQIGLMVLLTGIFGIGFGGMPAEAASQIGLLDLQRVLVELELSVDFDEKIQARDEALSSVLQERREQYENLLRGRREKYGEELTEEQIVELRRFENQANQQLHNLMQSSQQELREYQQRLIRELHDGLRPSVRVIAQQQGMQIIMLRSDIFFMVNQQLDITDMLIEFIRERPSLLDSLRPKE